MGVFRRILPVAIAVLAIFGCSAAAGAEAGPENVLVVVNARSRISREIAEYYVHRRQIPQDNVCKIRAPEEERIEREVFDLDVARPIFKCLKSRDLQDRILYIATTRGVPLAIHGQQAKPSPRASVDSELAMLYRRFEKDGKDYKIEGPLPNPFFGQYRKPFTHPEFPIYLVTRLTGYTIEDVKAMIDRGMEAKNRGVVVLDMHSTGTNATGNNWMEQAARILPPHRVRIDRTTTVMNGLTSVIGYASWGSNDPARRDQQMRWPGMEWLPGAIATQYVSSDGRSFTEPPEGWTIGNWSGKEKWHAGSPQSMSGDFIREGATGASGHTNEPYLTYAPRPNFLFPAYLTGRSLAESYYLSIPAVSWQNVIVGDPLCRLQ